MQNKNNAIGNTFFSVSCLRFEICCLNLGTETNLMHFET
jgi:hypothetical protein